MSKISYREGSYLSANSSGFSNVVFSDWGEISSPIIVGVHGFSCNARDFDIIASYFVDEGYRFIGVDLPGRGRSDYLDNSDDYCLRQYVQDIAALFAHLGITEEKSIDFIGVSLGGLLGIRLASMKNSPIKRLIINDIGPEISANAVEMMKNNFSTQYIFSSIKELETRMRNVNRSTWGYLTPEQWEYMAENNARAMPDGRITFAYDVNINRIFQTQPVGEIDLWDCWGKLDIDILLLRGQNSDMLPFEMAVRMKRELPHEKMTLKEFENCGHVPSLMYYDHIEAVLDWLRNTNNPQISINSPVVNIG